MYICFDTSTMIDVSSSGSGSGNDSSSSGLGSGNEILGMLCVRI